MSSTLHQSGVIDFDNLNGEKGFTGKVRNPGYCNSKLANAYFCQELARRTADTGVEVFAVCPGFCYTGLFRYSKVKWYQKVLFLPIAFFFMRSAAQVTFQFLFIFCWKVQWNLDSEYCDKKSPLIAKVIFKYQVALLSSLIKCKPL